MRKNIVLCKFGKHFDYMEIEKDDNYMVDVIEPFLKIPTDKSQAIAKQRLVFKGSDGARYDESVRDVVVAGLKVYYHDKPMNFNVDQYPGVRQPGLIDNLLGAIEVVVDKNNLK